MHKCGFYVVGNMESVSAMFNHLGVVVCCCGCLACKLNLSYLQPDLINLHPAKSICRENSGVWGLSGV